MVLLRIQVLVVPIIMHQYIDRGVSSSALSQIQVTKLEAPT